MEPAFQKLTSTNIKRNMHKNYIDSEITNQTKLTLVQQIPFSISFKEINDDLQFNIITFPGDGIKNPMPADARQMDCFPSQRFPHST